MILRVRARKMIEVARIWGAMRALIHLRRMVDGGG